jgi:hypothetical protein
VIAEFQGLFRAQCLTTREKLTSSIVKWKSSTTQQAKRKFHLRRKSRSWSLFPRQTAESDIKQIHELVTKSAYRMNHISAAISINRSGNYRLITLNLMKECWRTERDRGASTTTHPEIWLSLTKTRMRTSKTTSLSSTLTKFTQSILSPSTKPIPTQNTTIHAHKKIGTLTNESHHKRYRINMRLVSPFHEWWSIMIQTVVTLAKGKKQESEKERILWGKVLPTSKLKHIQTLCADIEILWVFNRSICHLGPENEHFSYL